MGNEPLIMAHGGEMLNMSPNINESTKTVESGLVPTQYHPPTFPSCPEMVVPPRNGH